MNSQFIRFGLTIVLLVSVCMLMLSCTSAPGNTVKITPIPSQVDQLIDDYYKAVSGKGDKDFSLLRSLLLPSAQFNAMGINEQGQNQYYPLTLNEYIEHLTPYIKEQGFYQTERYRKADYFNKIAQVWSVYESRNTSDGEIIDRGIYSFHLVQLDGEWKIANILWNSETTSTQVPEHYFKR